MAKSNDLKGLMKFLQREEWQECFSETFSDHFDYVLKELDIEFEELAEIIGADIAMNLWGCAFEDFLTAEFDVPGTNIVDEYLRRRGWNERAQSKAYMKGLRNSVMSLYEVSAVVPGKSFMARDLLRGGEPVLISEQSATQMLKQWDHIAARIVAMPGKNIIGGGVLPFTPEMSEQLLEIHKSAAMEAKSNGVKWQDGDLFKETSAVFSIVWTTNTLAAITNPELPKLENSEGDAVMFHDIRYPLAKGVKIETVAQIIDTIAGMQREEGYFWNWLENKQSRPEKSAKKSAAKTDKGRDENEDVRIWDVTMDDGRRVLGNVEMRDTTLHLLVNSPSRAERGRKLLEDVLGEMIGTPMTEIQTVEQMSASNRAQSGVSDSDDEEIPPEMAFEVMRRYMDDHYRKTLNEPLPVLGDVSPRKAVKTKAGRQKVVEWLKYIENKSAHSTAAKDGMEAYDFGWMWEELGISDLRK